MHYPLYAAIFAWTFYTCYRYGIGRAFGWCMLPVILLVNFAKGGSMPLLPNLNSLNMVLYGVLAALPMRWNDLRLIKWGWMETIMFLMATPIFITIYITSYNPPSDLKLAWRESMEFSCRWLFPFLMAKIALQNTEDRESAFKVLCGIAIVLGLMLAPIEMTFSPNMSARFLQKLQWDMTTNVGILKRWGLARAMITMGQPIDLGNVGVMVGTFILVLTPATGRKWMQPLPLLGVLGAGAMVFASISLTAWIATTMCFGCFFLLSRPGIGKYLIIPIVFAEICAMIFITHKLLAAELGPKPVDDPAASSAWIRTKIMQDAYPQASTAGVFGYGLTFSADNIAVGSVDNAYLLTLMKTGWYSLVLWFVLIMTVAVKGTLALARAQTATERLPVAAAMSGFLAMVFAMFTVFFGFSYANMWCVLLGMIAAMCQMLAARKATAGYSLHGGYMPHGVVMAGGMR
jgi:hypothetical protein